MVTFEELVGKFKLVNVAPYGACIIVPGNEFDPDWEAALADQGCRFHFVDLGGKPVTLVQKGKKSEAGGKKLVYEPPGAEESSDKVGTKEDSKKTMGVATPKVEKRPEEKLKGRATNLLARVWSSDDEQNLLKRINALPGTIEQKCIRLSSEFIGRSPAAIHQKYVKLQRKIKGSGRIGRPKKEPKGPAAEKGKCLKCGLPVDLCACTEEKKEGVRIKYAEQKGIVGSEPASTLVHTPTSTPVRNASDDLAVQKLVETLGALTDVVDKLSCNAVMHALEIRELKSKDDFKIPLGFWIAYSNALLEDDKKYRDVFRDKVRKLLEASE